MTATIDDARGNLALDWDPSGLLSQLALGGVTESIGHNSFGEVTTRSVTAGQNELHDVSVQRDLLGRIETKTESILGDQASYTYSYDDRGRLSEVTKDGAAYRSYTYDANGNRLTASEDGGTAVSATFDAQDPIATLGSTTYAHKAMGQRTSKTVGSDVSTCDYDELGNLMEVVLPTKTMSYVVDGQARCVARKVDGAITNRYLYGYVGADAVNSVDPTGLATLGGCFGFLGFGIGEQICLIVDDDFNVGYSSNSMEGWQGPVGVSGSLQAQSSTADTIHDLEGPFAYGGASVGPLSGAGISVDVFGNMEGCPTDAVGAEVGVSVGVPPFDVHGGYGETNVRGFNAPEFIGQVGSWINPFG